ncbi:unnamed protein product [Cylicocyclus nassatus]|uniref:Uncharacterized protein n=1 Tax=Cylicocyclus nassatus TaxID=53992 RepID=A0AA36H6C3_CYLNA|nr:unnamed protein product [Cylicocyclus nassatus]
MAQAEVNLEADVEAAPVTADGHGMFPKSVIVERSKRWGLFGYPWRYGYGYYGYPYGYGCYGYPCGPYGPYGFGGFYGYPWLKSKA